MKGFCDGDGWEVGDAAGMVDGKSISRTSASWLAGLLHRYTKVPSPARPNPRPASLVSIANTSCSDERT